MIRVSGLGGGRSVAYDLANADLAQRQPTEARADRLTRLAVADMFPRVIDAVVNGVQQVKQKSAISKSVLLGQFQCLSSECQSS